MVKQRPINFTAEDVQAILADRKTQTRRAVKQGYFPDGQQAAAIYPARESGWIAWAPDGLPGLAEFTKKAYKDGFPCPFGQPGDMMWVREPWGLVSPKSAGSKWADLAQRQHILHPASNEADGVAAAIYQADGEYDLVHGADGMKYKGWRPAIHMPRWASRITLEIVKVRVERLCDITVTDVVAEGFNYPNAPEYGRVVFFEKWDERNPSPKHSFLFDPWVWVIEFKQVPF